MGAKQDRTQKFYVVTFNVVNDVIPFWVLHFLLVRYYTHQYVYMSSHCLQALIYFVPSIALHYVLLVEGNVFFFQCSLKC